MTAALLLEFGWKSGLVAGAVLVGAALLQTRPAAERVAVLRFGVVMILSLPLLAVMLPAMRIDTPRFTAPAEQAAPAIAGPATGSPAGLAAFPLSPARAAEPLPLPVAPAWPIDPGVAAIALWALVAGALLLRLGAGVVVLHRWTRRAEPVRDPRWLSALDRAAPGATRPVLRASRRVRSPLSWGVRPAVILLNPGALNQAGRADAVLTHEMGHVRHGDWLFLMLTRLLVAVLWFNPLIWLLQRELTRQSEQAADAWAVRRIDRADYATALLEMAAGARPHAALGMAAPKGELARRVAAVISAPAGRGGRPWATALAIAGCIGFATPLAAVELAPRTVATEPAPAQPRGPRSATPPPSPSRVAAVALGSGATLARDLRDRTDERGPDTKAQQDNRIEIAADNIEVDAGGVLRAGGAGLRINAGGTVFRIDAPVAVQVSSDPSASPQDRAAFVAAQQAAAREAVRQADSERAAAMREGARQLRQGAAELEAGAFDMERAAAAGEPNQHPDIRPRAADLRRQAADIRRQADAMEAEVGVNASFNANANADH